MLGRWIDLDAHPLDLSAAFDYVVPSASALSVPEIEAYFGRVKALHNAQAQWLGADYLDAPSEPFFAPIAKADIEQRYEATRVLAAYSTIERSVDSVRLAARLRAAVESAPDVHLRTNCTVRGVMRCGNGGLEVEFDNGDSTHKEGYDAVVNAAWAGRLGIDATLNLVPSRPWLYRYKFGVGIHLPPGRSRPPTVTMIHGPFGDVVDFPSGRTYVSWYPSGMVGTSSAVVPPDWEAEVDEAGRRQICHESISALADFCPTLRDLPAAVAESADVKGGVIFAWGTTDICDAASELHQRFDIGIVSAGNYHTVDPGKYTMVPLLAVEVCDRIEGTEHA
jgi:hypothetical protein